MRYPDFIEELLLAKTYAELTNAENQTVKEFVANEEEYTKIRELLLGIEGAVDEQKKEVIPPHIENKLHKAFEAKHKAKKVFTMRWQLISTLSIAASLALIIYIGTLFKKQPQSTEVAVNTKTEQVKKDTPKTIESQPKTIEPTLKEEEEKATKKIIKPLPPPPVEVAENETKELSVVEDDIEEIKVLEELELNTVNVEEVTVVEKRDIVKIPPKRQLNNNIEVQETYDSHIMPSSVESKPQALKKIASVNSVSAAEHTDLLDLGVAVY